MAFVILDVLVRRVAPIAIEKFLRVQLNNYFKLNGSTLTEIIANEVVQESIRRMRVYFREAELDLLMKTGTGDDESYDVSLLCKLFRLVGLSVPKDEEEREKCTSKELIGVSWIREIRNKLAHSRMTVSEEYAKNAYDKIKSSFENLHFPLSEAFEEIKKYDVSYMLALLKDYMGYAGMKSKL